MQIKQENDGHAVIDQLTGEEVLTYAINIGEQLLMSGAEISRVEDTIRRICAAYDIRQSHIFSIASCIIVTLETKDHKWITQTRRILSYGTDMWKLDRLNNLSRLICSTKPPLERINREYALILNGPVYPPVVQCLIYAMTAGAFANFTDSANECPWDRYTLNAPQKTSPAPVVSIVSTSFAGIMVYSSFSFT